MAGFIDKMKQYLQYATAGRVSYQDLAAKLKGFVSVQRCQVPVVQQFLKDLLHAEDQGQMTTIP